MICPSCRNGKTKVKSSAAFVEDGATKVLRERVCGSCGYKFNTVEKSASLPEKEDPK